jgi:hypothetical protein
MTQPTEEPEPESQDVVQQGEEILRRYIGEERLEAARGEPRQRVFHVGDLSAQQQSETPPEDAPDDGIVVRVGGHETGVLQVELAAELRKTPELVVSDSPPPDNGELARLHLKGPSPALVSGLSTVWRWYMEQLEERGREVKISIRIKQRRELHMHELDLAEARTRLEELKRNV